VIFFLFVHTTDGNGKLTTVNWKKSILFEVDRTYMENSTIIASDYKQEYSHLNGIHVTRITRTDIARGIVSIGKTHWMQHLRTPRRSFFDFIHYWSGLQSYVVESPQLSLSPLFSQLDGSEKGSKSYQIGM